MVVSGVADAPVAADDTATTDEDSPVTVDVLANDNDADANLDPASVAVTVAPAHGTTSVDPAHRCRSRTPRTPNWSGTDTFTYQVCDPGTPALCDTAVVTVDVAAVNDAPVAADDTATTDEDAPVTVDVLANDGDLEGALDPASVSVIGGPSHGSVSIDPVTGADHAIPRTRTTTGRTPSPTRSATRARLPCATRHS